MAKYKENKKIKSRGNKYKLVVLYIIIPFALILLYRAFSSENGTEPKHKHINESQKTELNLKLPTQNK